MDLLPCTHCCVHGCHWQQRPRPSEAYSFTEVQTQRLASAFLLDSCSGAIGWIHCSIGWPLDTLSPLPLLVPTSSITRGAGWQLMGISHIPSVSLRCSMPEGLLGVNVQGHSTTLNPLGTSSTQYYVCTQTKTS